MVSLGDSSVPMFHDDFDYQGPHSAGLYTDMLAARQDNIYNVPFTHAFDQGSLEESYTQNGMSTYDSYPPVPAYRTYYDSPNLIVSAPQDAHKHNYLMPTPEGSPAHSSLHSFDPPPSVFSSSGASIPSAASSTMGSPYSNGGHIVHGVDPWSDMATQGLGIGPSIVQQDSFGNESFALQDAPLFDPSDKTLSAFVGECSQISSSPRAVTPVPLSSSTRQLSSLNVSFGLNVKTEDTDPTPTEGQQRTPTRDDRTFKSPRTLASARSSISFASRSPSGTPTPAARGPPGATPPKPKAPKSPDTLASSRTRHHRLPEPNIYAGFHPSPFFSQSSGNFIAPLQASYPSLIQPFSISGPFDHVPCPMTTTSQDITTFNSPHISQFRPPSPAPSDSPSRPGSAHRKTGSSSPYLRTNPYHQPYYPSGSRRPSISSVHSLISGRSSHRGSPTASGGELDDETREKGRCTECGKAFKDLKAHLLTHQNERPEKCPIVSCEYHQKGFARKYDKNRHTLTHYKGTMVCGFCPGSGSAAEKSFNRADVFKRHLTSVHNVEQAPPNSRKKNSSGSSGTNFPTYPADATGKCSTCGLTFSNAQDFYEHLDECVLRIVQQEDPFAAINERNINSVSNDEAVQQTMRANALPLNSNYADQEENLDESEGAEEDEDYEKDDEKDDTWKASGSNTATGRMPSTRARTGVKRSGSGAGTMTKNNQQTPAPNSRGCITKVRRSASSGKGTFTYSKGGVPLLGKGKKRRKDYPPSWGCSADKMAMKKRGLYVFDGPRRLWKDDLMMSTEFEVRMPLRDGKYFTDLDDLTVKRAEAFHDATEEEKGPSDVDIRELMS
ncbi:MAG: hypothetical protein M1840_001650 [Geoglossum simile]|nr:MAG: hypothetical protein M1840_001650 [Geoglossum simile]